MSGYQGRGGDYDHPDRYGGRGDRDRRDDRGGNNQERRRSRSPGRGHSRGGGYNRGRGDGSRGNLSHDGREGSRSSQPFVSELPPLPNKAPFPEGTGREVPYPNVDVRGTIGMKVLFTVNHHVIETLPVIKIFQYDLRFKVPPSSQARGSDKVTAQQMARVLTHATLVDFLGPNFVFDGVSLGWSPTELMAIDESRTTTISLGQRKDDKPNEVEIEIACSGTLDILSLVQYLTRGNIETNPSGNSRLENQLKWLQAVFRSDIQTRMVSRPNSNAFFDRSPGTTAPLHSTGGVLEARRGIFQTMQLRFQKLTINVDTATTPFWVPGKSLIECVCSLMRVVSPERLEEEFLRDTGRFFQACGKLLGMFFNVRHLNEIKNSKKIKFQAWSREDAIATQFEEEVDGSKEPTSVKDYFNRKYGIRLHFPRLPLAKTRAGEFPLELCYSAADERYKEVLQGAETADFIKFATAPAYIRRQQIIENTKMIAWHKQSTLRAHGLSVNPNMMVVKALILPPPEIIYGSSTVSSNDGQWNLRGVRFLRPSTIKSWALIFFSHTLNPALEKFTLEIIKGFRSLGMAVPSQPPAIMLGNPFGDIKSAVDSAIIKAQSLFGSAPDVIFLLMQGASVPLYTAIKNSLDVNEGIASQVMLVEKALKDRGQLQYIANIAMKVNVKLGGVNCTIKEPLFDQNRWMLIGGDLSMGSPSAIHRDPPPPTTVALTGTYDKQCTAYTAVASVQQTSHVGIIEHAGIMFKDLLTRYKDRNNGLMPQHIIYYRDGASESEFGAILNKEGQALRNLCKEFGTKITIIVAVKRHHTRFMAEGSFATKLGNVPPGTVVENASQRNDAYIVTQRDLQGTKRPTRYITLVDENRLSADDFNRLIYGLCSTYARATTSVAVVPPIYYADQACERSRLHLQDKQDGTKFLPTVHKNLSWRMYWQ